MYTLVFGSRATKLFPSDSFRNIFELKTGLSELRGCSVCFLLIGTFKECSFAFEVTSS